MIKKLLQGFLLLSFVAVAGGAAYNPSKPISDSNPAPSAIVVGDNPSLDAAGRFRESAPYGIFEDKRLYGLGTGIWEDVASGVSSVSTFNSNEATISLTVGTGANDYLYRQTRYFPYVSGKSQLIKITLIDGAGVANTAKRAGYFDDKNGMYFQQLGNTLSMCVRTSTSGSPVDTCYPQSAWNLDRLDGSCNATTSNCSATANPSGLTIDASKAELLVIDYLWQGVGRIRFGFQINGITYYVHQVLNANNISVPFIGTPSLPVRYEIRNVGTSAGGTMKQICVSVESEGGYTLPGYEFTAANAASSVSITTRAPVLAIRLANTFKGKENRKIVRILHSSYRAATNDAFCELVHMHFPVTAVGGTWLPVNNDSAVEYNTGLTSVTSAISHVIDDNYISAGTGNTSSSLSSALDWINYHGLLSQNAASTGSQMFVVFCTSMSNISLVSAELNWIEAE